MKKFIQITLGLLCIHLSIQAQQRYAIDNKKSKINWKVETIGKHHGYILFNNGRLDYAHNGEPNNGYFIIDMKSMRSNDRPTPKGREELDKQLRSLDFFDVAHYPSATMDVKQVTPTATASIYKVKGNLTIKGISNAIEFNATFSKKGDLVQVKAKLSIDRTKWNIDHKPEPKPMDFFGTLKDKMMTDDIMIELDLTFYK